METSGVRPGAPLRKVVRFGQRVRGDELLSVPARYRRSPGSPGGRLEAVRLLPASGQVWLRLRPSDVPWRKVLRTVPLGEEQQPAPPPDTLELRGGMRVRCHDGVVGRLEGVALDVVGAVALDLVVRIRGDVAADVPSPDAPLAHLLRLRGRTVLLSPGWAVTTERATGNAWLRGGSGTLLLDASGEQVASGSPLRGDGEVAGEIAARLAENPALTGCLAGISISVRDGEVTVRGNVPTSRQRATVAQEVWHVPGVFALHDLLRVTS